MPARYTSEILEITFDELGSSWQDGLGCPGPGGLRAVEVRHWGYDDEVHEGRIVVAAAEAERVAAIFGDLFEARFPIEQIVPIDAFDGDDDASMRANNTSGFNCRFVAGTNRLSEHALGRAIDVNPLVNPYIRGDRVDPPEGAAFVDRDLDHPGMIRPGDAAVAAFAEHGWSWGGDWASPDLQHFSVSGR